ncbi:MAG: hypothetical protein J5817_02040 [Treponema sp.]|nr:hypothetical protein [Treponema sp.]
MSTKKNADTVIFLFAGQVFTLNIYSIFFNSPLIADKPYTQHKYSGKKRNQFRTQQRAFLKSHWAASNPLDSSAGFFRYGLTLRLQLGPATKDFSGSGAKS